MSLARTLTSFCIDISPSMGARRLITEEVLLRDASGLDAGTANFGTPDADGGLGHAVAAQEQRNGAGQAGMESYTRQRHTTDLEWTMEFVGRKIQNCILSGLKTAKVHILLFGSPRTRNTLLDNSKEVTEGYEGIDEILLPEQPTLATLELVRCLRAATPKENPHLGDPLDALVAAITTLNHKPSGGVTNTWRRTIYLITDGKSKMNIDDVALIKSRLRDDNITLKVVGIDFDDAEIGFKEEDKEPGKAQNEVFWRDFVDDLPGSGVASAAKVIAQASLPSVQLQGSAPYSTSLTFGDPNKRAESTEVLDVPIKVYKATAVARPLSQKKLSKIARDSAAARSQTARYEASSSQMRPSSTPSYLSPRKRAWEDDGGGTYDGVTYGVQLQRKYFLKEDLEHVEGGINAAEPLPEGAEATFDRAYKLGATLVAVNDDLERKLDTKAGIEIIQFTNRALYKRNYHMSETWFVFASDGNSKAELQLSSLIHAMWDQGKYAIVRFVRRDGSEPKVGILAPQIRDDSMGFDFECLFYVEAPFREDLKRFNFPPLDRVINREGKELYEHSCLPSKEMQNAMDELLDSMDLMDGDQDEDGEPFPWFRCEDSFNPAIHGIKEAVSWRVFHPNDRALPKPQHEVVKFLQPPEKVANRCAPIAERCRELFDLQYVPTSAARKQAGRREAQQRADTRDEGDNGEPKEIDLGGVMDEELAAEAVKSVDRTDVRVDETLHAASEIGTTARSSTVKQSMQRESEEADDSDALRISKIDLDAEDPIGDFNKKLGSRSFEVEDVIDALCALVRKTVESSFGSNDYTNARDMLIALRKNAIEYEEAPRYNSFVRKIKSDLLSTDNSKGRNRSDFWDNYVRGRDDLGLIRNDEALGDQTDVDAREAAEFINL